MGLVGAEFQVVFDLPPGVYQVSYDPIAPIALARRSDYVSLRYCTVYELARHAC
jgi:hypothetical protein